MFKRVFVANRGAVAGRIVRACEALGIDSVAAFSDIDAQAPHLQAATATARLPGYLAADTYLNGQALIAAAGAAGADALHPGYGFLAENADFARAVAAAGIRFVGPAPHCIEALGEKTRARAAMAERGFPVHAGSEIAQDEAALLEAAEQLGFPVILKPAHGGGGIGMTVAASADELALAFQTASALAERAFGDGGVYLERYLSRPRHIEFQILGDGAAATALFERDCSVQRRHQKLIEEAPAPGLPREALSAIAGQAAKALGSLGYDSVGTVETLFADGDFGFLEANARLQVEHSVTEEATGFDLVAAQLRLAAGATLDDLPLAASNLTQHAVEARVYAEDPQRMLPSAGRLQAFRPPRMAGVRVDVAYAEGQHVTPYYDPMLAKVIGVGATREQAIGRTLIALQAFEIRGVANNRKLLQRVLGSEAFIAGRLHTGFIDDLL